MTEPAPRYPAADQRTAAGLPQRQALVRLRLIEFVAADYLPPDLMQELTASIDGVIEIIRGRPRPLSGTDPDEGRTNARETLTRWGDSLGLAKRMGAPTDANRFSNWLFGAEMILLALGVHDLRAAAKAANPERTINRGART